MRENVFAGCAEELTLCEEGFTAEADGFDVCGVREVDEKLGEITEGTEDLRLC